MAKWKAAREFDLSKHLTAKLERVLAAALFSDAANGRLGWASTVLLATARALKRRHEPALRALHATAREVLELEGMEDHDADDRVGVLIRRADGTDVRVPPVKVRPRADRDDAFAILRGAPAGRFLSASEQERAIRARVVALIERGIGRAELAARLTKMLSLPPLLGRDRTTDNERGLTIERPDRERVRRVVDAGTRIALQRHVSRMSNADVERLIIKAMRAVGIDARRRPKPFPAAKRKRERVAAT